MIVVDCSALVDVLMGAPGVFELRAFLATEELHAPTLLDYEVVSAARGLTLGGHISAARAADLLSDFDDLPIQRWPFADGLRKRAFQLQDNLSTYDAAYLALAEALGCPVVTRDARLTRGGGHTAQVLVR